MMKNRVRTLQIKEKIMKFIKDGWEDQGNQKLNLVSEALTVNKEVHKSVGYFDQTCLSKTRTIKESLEELQEILKREHKQQEKMEGKQVGEYEQLGYDLRAKKLLGENYDLHHVLIAEMHIQKAIESLAAVFNHLDIEGVKVLRAEVDEALDTLRSIQDKVIDRKKKALKIENKEDHEEQ